jgi:hypothetical protein
MPRPANVGFVKGIPDNLQVISPVGINLSSPPYILNRNPSLQVNQANKQPGNSLRREIPGPTQAAVPSEDYTPPSSPPTAEYTLRQVASRYVNHPDSQVDAVCTERASAGRYKVTIALEVTGLL